MNIFKWEMIMVHFMFRRHEWIDDRNRRKKEKNVMDDVMENNWIDDRNRRKTRKNVMDDMMKNN